MGLGDCTVGTWEFYTDPITPATLFCFFTGNLADWWHPMLRLLSASELQISRPLRRSDMISLPIIA